MRFRTVNIEENDKDLLLGTFWNAWMKVTIDGLDISDDIEEQL